VDKKYWESYYAAQNPGDQPSDFAIFVGGYCDSNTGRLFDIGCGNGRDTLFFASQDVECTGIDQSEVAIENNQKKALELGLDAKFLQGDFSALEYSKIANGAYSIYSRFTLHAINYEEEAKLFNHLNNESGLQFLFIEARSLGDSLYGQGDEVGTHEFVTSHYRRFIDSQALQEKLKEKFEILFFEESQGFAKTPTEDPCLIRLVARRV
jgi:tellurite methyltransferase